MRTSWATTTPRRTRTQNARRKYARTYAQLTDGALTVAREHDVTRELHAPLHDGAVHTRTATTARRTKKERRTKDEGARARVRRKEDTRWGRQRKKSEANKPTRTRQGLETRAQNNVPTKSPAARKPFSAALPRSSRKPRAAVQRQTHLSPLRKGGCVLSLSRIARIGTPTPGDWRTVPPPPPLQSVVKNGRPAPHLSTPAPDVIHRRPRRQITAKKRRGPFKHSIARHSRPPKKACHLAKLPCLASPHARPLPRPALWPSPARPMSHQRRPPCRTA